MSRIWRRVTPILMAGGLVAALAVVAAGPAQATTAPRVRAGYGVSISATSPHYAGAVDGKVYGYALVIYATPQGDMNQARITGKITGARTGDVATLLAKPFGSGSFQPTGTPISLHPSGGAAVSYSFTVEPSVATAYRLRVSTAGEVDVTSSVQTVYVTPGAFGPAAHQKCSTKSCTYSYDLYFLVPASAYKVEAAKHQYLYQAVWYNRKKPAAFFYLAKTARATGPIKINSREFEIKLTFYIPLHNGGAHWTTVSCAKDDEPRDGIGLPGRHGCGNNRIRTDAIYIG